MLIEPFDQAMIQPCSVDLKIDRHFLVFPNHLRPYIDVKTDVSDLVRAVSMKEDEPFILHPGEFVLAQTLEYVVLPDDLVGRLEGKSSLGRLGLLIHQTAGLIDPGFSGTITLELSNVASLPITIYSGMPVGQITFEELDQPAERAYGSAEAGSKYQGQTRPTASRYHKNFD